MNNDMISQSSQQMQQLYVVRDRVAQCMIGQIMQFAHDAPAVRMFVDALQDGFMAKHPADFDLVCVGTIGMVDCAVVPNDGIRLVLAGETWFQTQVPQNPENQG